MSPQHVSYIPYWYVALGVILGAGIAWLTMVLMFGTIERLIRGTPEKKETP